MLALVTRSTTSRLANGETGHIKHSIALGFTLWRCCRHSRLGVISWLCLLPYRNTTSLLIDLWPTHRGQCEALFLQPSGRAVDWRRIWRRDELRLDVDAVLRTDASLRTNKRDRCILRRLVMFKYRYDIQAFQKGQ
jgi:hypothetical protein